MLCGCGGSYFQGTAVAEEISRGVEEDMTVVVDREQEPEVQAGGMYNKTEVELAGTEVLWEVEKKRQDQAFPTLDVSLKGIGVQVVGERLSQSQRSPRSAFWSRAEGHHQAFQRMQDGLTLLDRMARLVQQPWGPIPAG